MNTISGTGIPRAALINDLSCFGKCSLTVSIPILSACGVEAVALPTAVLSTHTGGFGDYRTQDMTGSMREFAAHWKSLGMKFECIYTGYLCSSEQLAFVRQFIADFSTPETLLLVDPVMGDNGKLYPIYDAAYVAAMRELVGLADVITPNRTEAALLAQLPFDSRDEDILAALNVKNTVLTSVQSGERIGYLARMEGRVFRVDYPRQSVRLHGTGDVFASALCGALLNGHRGETALRLAAEFCNECILETVRRQPGHWYGLAIEPVLQRGGAQWAL